MKKVMLFVLVVLFICGHSVPAQQTKSSTAERLLMTEGLLWREFSVLLPKDLPPGGLEIVWEWRQHEARLCAKELAALIITQLGSRLSENDFAVALAPLVIRSQGQLEEMLGERAWARYHRFKEESKRAIEESLKRTERRLDGKVSKPPVPKDSPPK